MKVLVVDDVAIMRTVFITLLHKFCGTTKKNIIEAINGREGVALYKKEKPDIVFLDISMPDLDGFTVVKRIMDFDPKAIIIMCTASPYANDVKACKRAGAKDYILKPPNPERVVKAMETFAPGYYEFRAFNKVANAQAEAEQKPVQSEALKKAMEGMHY